MQPGAPLPERLGRAMSHLEQCLILALQEDFLKILRDLIPKLTTFEERFKYFPDEAPEARDTWTENVKMYFWDFDGKCNIYILFPHRNAPRSAPLFAQDDRCCCICLLVHRL